MRRVFSLVFFLSLCLGAAAAGQPATYTLGVPMPVVLPCDETGRPVADGDVYANNCALAADAGSVFRTNDASFVSRVGVVNPAVALEYGVAGASWEVTKPQYYLADRIDEPEGVDWDATYAHFFETYKTEAERQSCGFVFSNDPDARGVYVTRGGAFTFEWVVVVGGQSQVLSQTYIFGTTSRDRPKRIYLTDPPYNGSKVSLQGKFVRFFGEESLVGMQRETVTNIVANQEVVEKKVTSGLSLDESSMTLEARGTRTGQAVLVYYADATYSRVLDLIVVEVASPITRLCRGVIGEPLQPTGLGQGRSKLFAVPNSTSITEPKDGLGPYLYQHYGEYSYYPHYGDVYAIRPTVGIPQSATVVWKEEDAMHVQWDFEIDQYECDWPEDAPCFVCGDKDKPGRGIKITEPYAAEIMKYQTPNGHAAYNMTNRTFSADVAKVFADEGLSLMKLTANNNIWFLPIRSVMRTNDRYYTRTPIPLAVGQEASLDAVPRTSVAADVRIAATADAGAGYVYGSGTPEGNYDANLYSETNSASAVYPVSAAGDIEVWWSASVTRGDMPKPISVPSLPAVYRPYWPATEEAPQIVLASQQGGAGTSRYGHFGAATFDSVDASLAMPSRTYFPNGEGTVMFWTRASSDPNMESRYFDVPSCLINFQAADCNCSSLRLGYTGRLELVTNDAVAASAELPAKARGNDWVHIAYAFDAKGGTQLFVNGESIKGQAAGGGSATSPSDSALAGFLTECTIGMPHNVDTNVTLSAEMAAVIDLPPDPTTFTFCSTWQDVKNSLLQGKNARLAKNVDASFSDGIVSISSGTVTLDLAGFTVSLASGSEADFLFDLSDGCTLVLTDSNKGGRIVGTGTSGQQALVYGGFAGLKSKARLVMKGGILEKLGNPYPTGAGVVRLNGGGSSFVMTGGVIKQCAQTTTSGNGGGVRIEADSTFVMTGGEITNCSAYLGGGVYCKGEFVMAGGRISGCSANEGGGVSTAFSGKMYLLGGEIVDNAARERFGGIRVTDNGRLEMYGGLVARNKATEDNPCIGLYGSGATGSFAGGVIDVVPTAEKICRNGANNLTVTGYWRDSATGLVYLGCGTAVGRQIAEVLVYNRCLGQAEVGKEMRCAHTGSEADVTGYWSFRPGEDLEATGVSHGTETRTFVDRGRGGALCTAKNAILTTPGAPLDGPCVLLSDTEVSIYRQNDSTKKGYNPNEEHAFAEAGSGGYVVWALRCDLGLKDARQGVFAEYAKDGRNALQYFHVVATNATWPVLGAVCTAGRALPGPLPLTTMSDPWLANDTWTGSAVYRDRKKQLWCRDGGHAPFNIHMWYRQQDTFDWPTLDKPPATGTAVPWLSLLGMNPGAPGALTNQPHPWRWTPKWPDKTEEMAIGQTLTVAENGLPEVWSANSVAVVYPDTTNASNVVRLTDPTARQAVKLSKADFDATELTVGGNGGLTLRAGIYRFTEASPFISSRFGYDPNAEELFLTGQRDEKGAGVSVLYPNVLSSAERTAVRALVKDAAKGKAKWDEAVGRLATAPIEPNSSKLLAVGKDGSELVTTYGAVDHYALTAVGMTNYVVLIENDATAETMTGYKAGQAAATGLDCPVAAGDPINMHVFKVVPRYYCGRVVTRQDENNLLSQQQSVLYTDPIGGKADDFEFEWQSHAPNADGTVPTPGVGNWLTRAPSQSVEGGSPYGLTRFVIGQQGDTLDNMVNKYWTCRYRGKSTSAAHKVMNGAWSDWCTPPALAEGWLQRVLNNVTPFNQRMTDLLNNKAETAVSMIQQAGKPFTGDVALNQDNLANVGLIELYETLLNKAESMSILLGSAGQAACQQLLLAVERLHDLYGVLGDEAYSDAKNPTVGFGSTVSFAGTTQTAVDFGAESSSLFCFDNQVKTLLDEEICLLRGRSGVSAPTCRIGPYYNRLLWNFTKGITAGEVAYAVNYGISGTETVALSEEQAARLYPQGHGDAYGHYLSALKGWYRLLRNPNFSWGKPVQGEMNLADAAVNVDYYEEAKFAEAAVRVARTAAEVVDLTARQAWRESAKDGTVAGYFDSNAGNAFGYGEWASRGGYGALVNWAVANSLLPIDQTLSSGSIDPSGSSETIKYTDQGLTRIDRGNTDELAELCEQAAAIVRAVDRIDGGLNPLGLSDRAIPFDITPKGVTDGSNTHYEQVRDRAKTALANARKVLDRAQTQSNRLKMIQETAESYANAITSEEEDLDNQLVGYYGTPYTGDIGAGKTYAEGYTGPDLLHYFYMDLEQYGLNKNDITNFTAKTVSYSSAAIAALTDRNAISAAITNKLQTSSVAVNVSRLGLVVKPATVTGYRVSPGTIQEKYAELLLKIASVKSAEASLNKAVNTYARVKANVEAVSGEQGHLRRLSNAVAAANMASDFVTMVCDIVLAKTKTATVSYKDGNETKTSVLPDFVSAIAWDSDQAVKNVAALAKLADSVKTELVVNDAATGKALFVFGEAELENALSLYQNELNYRESERSLTEELRTAALDLSSASYDYHVAATELNALIDTVATEIQTAEALLTKRENLRKRQVDQISQLRYNEMLFRRIRDKTLTRYQAVFDLAQKYVFQAAQVYDFETGLKREKDGSGDAFKAKIIATRALGAFSADGEPMVADDGDLGLAGYLAQMEANWLVLKPRLGINNPQDYTTWFSLRQELFRIYGTEAGDRKWAEELGKHWVEDIRETDVYRRQCQAFQSQFGLKDKEPGLVIPFSTTVDFAKNFFGHDLAGGDHGYDSTWYSTRIAAAGVWFDGYNEKTANAAASAQVQLAATPTVYLVPDGSDCLRVPGFGDGTFWSFSVVDQVIPAPYQIGSYELDDDTWYPNLAQADWGDTSPTVKVRRHPMFRAYYGSEGAQPSDDRLDATRLVGRSVWNDKWYLIIPAGSLNADRDLALSVFINGLDTNRDGKRDLKPVSDIKIGFRTYSQSGN